MSRLTKTWLASLACRLSESPLLKLPALQCDGRSNVLRVLTYHRVDWPDARPDLSSTTLSATPTGFAAQMECLREHFQVVGLDEVREAFARGRKLPPKAVLITFDDAFRDFRQHAWPVLQRLELPVTLFVPTAFPNQPSRVFWWDLLHHLIAQAPSDTGIETRFGRLQLSAETDRRDLYSRLAARLARMPHNAALQEVHRLAELCNTPPAPPAVLPWTDLKLLAAEGVSLAPHTRTHPLMNRISLEQARDELRGAREDLAAHIGDTPPVFAYPGGAYSREVLRLLADEGFELAFTTCRGANDLHRCDPLQLRRINVGRRTTPELLRAQLSLPPEVANLIWPLRSAA
ncbi:MAG: polysaccharide deacetylase family protein [Planctomycetota bacterium]|nr:polysaccharide deacetylase family protein [Planctomycetota bacterium]